jgi:hypothetical protein
VTTTQINKERWKPIPEYERYFVSECGRVWDSLSKRLIRPTKSDSNYLTVRLTQFKNPKIRKTLKIHRLVTNAFVGHSNMHVNHKNRNKMDNHIYNLEYVTPMQNVHHALVTKPSPSQIVTCHLCNLV